MAKLPRRKPAPKRRNRLRFALVVLLLGITIGACFSVVPASARLLVRTAEYLLNRNPDIDLNIGKIEGSIADTIVLSDVVLKTRFQGMRTDMTLPRIDVQIRLHLPTLDLGKIINADVSLVSPKGTVLLPADTLPDPRTLDLLALQTVTIYKGNLLFRRGQTLCTIANLTLSSPRASMGTAWFEAVEWSSPEFRLRLPAGRAWVDRAPDRLVFTNVQVAESVELSELRFLFSGSTRREITVSAILSGFGGLTRGQAYLREEANGLFASIAALSKGVSLKEISRFLHWEPAREGTIEEAKISFQGDLSDPAAANISVHTLVRDFVWQDRRWESLLIGAAYFNRHIELTDFRLDQPKNRLQLKGTMDLTSLGLSVPETFRLDVKADLNDLTEFANLLLDDPPPTSGKLTIAGNISRSDKGFDGELTLGGEAIRIRSAPIERVSAKLLFRGSELEVSELEAKNGSDFLRGKLSMLLALDGRYSGALEASISEMGNYAPLLPERFAGTQARGALQFRWNGDGTRTSHSGVFSAAFKEARFFDAAELAAEGDLQGSYSPGNLAITKLEIRDQNTHFSASASAHPDEVQIHSMRVVHKNQTWLEGSATLPFNYPAILKGSELWQVVRPEGETKIAFKSSELDLATLSALLRIPNVIQGKLTFEISGSGPLEDLRLYASGAVSQFAVTNGAITTPAATINLSAEYGDGAATLNGELAGKDSKPVAISAVVPIEITETALRQNRVFRPNRPLVAAIGIQELPAQWFDLLIPGVRVESGKISALISLSGTADAPGIFGTVSAQGLRLSEMAGIPSLDKFDAAISLFRQDATIERISAKTRTGGTLEASGKIRFVDLFHPSYTLRATLANWPLWNTPWTTAEGRAELEFRHHYGFQFLDGTVTIEELLPGRDILLLQPAGQVPIAGTPLLDGILPPLLGSTILDLVVRTAPGTEMAAPSVGLDLKILGTGAKPLPVGAIELNHAVCRLQLAETGTSSFQAPVSGFTAIVHHGILAVHSLDSAEFQGSGMLTHSPEWRMRPFTITADAGSRWQLRSALRLAGPETEDVEFFRDAPLELTDPEQTAREFLQLKPN